MPASPDRPATPARLRRLFDGGALDTVAYGAALETALHTPPAIAWRRFLDRAMLAVGATLTLIGVVAFFAYNWASLGRLSRVGLVEALLIAAGIAALVIGVDRLGGQIAGTAAVALSGVLLAAIGQAYQQGADPWTLFAVTAALGLPWLLATRFAPLWLLELALANVALGLWWNLRINDLGPDFTRMLLTLGALNGGAWLSWNEGAAAAGLRAGRWLPRTVALATLAPLTAGAAAYVAIDVLHYDIAPQDRFGASGLAVFAAWLAVTAVILVLFRRRRPDLFVLAAAVLGIIVVLTTGMFRWLFEWVQRASDVGGPWLVMSAFLLLEAGLAALWLRREQLAMSAALRGPAIDADGDAPRPPAEEGGAA
ncbi:MAG: DUF2157 domain-containing protein [Ardenticatenales bacterium]